MIVILKIIQKAYNKMFATNPLTGPLFFFIFVFWKSIKNLILYMVALTFKFISECINISHFAVEVALFSKNL